MNTTLYKTSMEFGILYINYRIHHIEADTLPPQPPQLDSIRLKCKSIQLYRSLRSLSPATNTRLRANCHRHCSPFQCSVAVRRSAVGYEPRTLRNPTRRYGQLFSSVFDCTLHTMNCLRKHLPSGDTRKRVQVSSFANKGCVQVHCQPPYSNTQPEMPVLSTYLAKIRLLLCYSRLMDEFVANERAACTRISSSCSWSGLF